MTNTSHNHSPNLSTTTDHQTSQTVTPLTATDNPINDSADLQAAILAGSAYPGFVASVVGPSFAGIVHSEGFVAYRDNLFREAGNPSDPVERMLLEQMALAHLHIGLLHVKAAAADSIDAAKAYLGVACRMQSEFRRQAIARRELRSPVRTKAFTVVHQANVAGGDQSVALVTDRKSGPRKKNVFGKAGTEVSTKQQGALADGQVTPIVPKPPAACCQPQELAVASRTHRGRAPEAARSRAAE